MQNSNPLLQQQRIDKNHNFGIQSPATGKHYTNPIPISKFEEYSENPDEIQSEFEKMNPTDSQLHSWEIAAKNKDKHRYEDLLTYDHTRVTLKSSKFIAANWVDSCLREKRYIATQCPTETTVMDFYRMIWEYGIEQVVNLASPKDMGTCDGQVHMGKGYKYYPEHDSSRFGDFEIVLISREAFPDVILRRYQLRNANDTCTHHFSHYHFQSWPDLETPEKPSQILNLINLYKNDSAHPNSGEKPLLVHCMAGVGRSGTLILTDSMMELCKISTPPPKHLDFLAHLWKIRNQRISMVEKPKQYIYAHQVVALHIREIRTAAAQ